MYAFGGDIQHAPASVAPQDKTEEYDGSSWTVGWWRFKYWKRASGWILEHKQQDVRFTLGGFSPPSNNS